MHSLYIHPHYVQYTCVTHHVCLCILPGLPPQSSPIISPPQVPQDTTLSNNHSKKTYPIPSLRAMAHTLRYISQSRDRVQVLLFGTNSTDEKNDRRAPGVQMFQTPGLSAAGWADAICLSEPTKIISDHERCYWLDSCI